MTFNDVLIKPVLSEKATALREQNKYTFIVDPAATKFQIKEAVRKLFNVNVEDCKTINEKGNCKTCCWRNNQGVRRCLSL